MPFAVCYYHVIWSTHGRQPLITPPIEKILFETIQRKSELLKSPIHAINSVKDHIHVAVSIAPAVSVAEWVGSVKGASTHEVNVMLPNIPTRFQWQKSYGVLTFGRTHLPFVVGYIAGQKDHHRDKTTIDYLENSDDAF